MIEDIFGETKWPAAFLLAALAALWAWNVREDSAQRHDLDVQIVEECGRYESEEAVTNCAERIRNAL